MGTARALADIGDVAVLAIFWSALLFPVVTGLFWKWWQTQFGLSYMMKTILLAVATSGAAANRMFGVSLGSVGYLAYVDTALGLIPVVIVWRGWVLWKEQRAGRALNPATAVREWARARRAARDGDRAGV